MLLAAFWALAWRAALVRWPSSAHDLRSGAPQAAKAPLPHQQDALRAIAEGLSSNHRGKVIMACGTGKTLIALWAAEQAGTELTLVLVPSLWLLRQTAQEWAANASRPARSLKVCSDRGASEDDMPALIDVADVGPGVTTNPTVIRSFLNSDGPRVVFATYQSSAQIAKAMATDCGAVFDIAICDEAHWCAGLAGRSNKTILDEDKIRALEASVFSPLLRPFTRHTRLCRPLKGG